MKFFPALTLAASLLVTINACSTTPKITSQFNTPEISEAEPADLSSLIAQVERESVDGLNFFMSHDEQNLYLTVDFISLRLYQQALEFGFTVFIDHEDGFKRSFGVTYPTGLYYELGDYPGARKGYIEEPDWESIPQNISIKESAERNIYQRALITQRRNRQQDLSPVPVPLLQLEAQNLRLQSDQDERSGRIHYTIPLETRSTSQFAPDIQPGETVDLGFEIHPVRLFNLDSGMRAPMLNRQSRSGNTQSDQDEEIRTHINLIMRRLLEPYEEWVKVTLEPAD